MSGNGRALALTPSDISLPQTAVERGIAPEQWATLKGALYPGKSDQMVLLAFDYCRARGLDPIKKPVHIVKTWDPDQGGMVETIWEGINSHRVTASRTGVYAGQDEAEFGPEVTRALGSAQVSFPTWCRVTVYRMVCGQRCAFTGTIRWIETYSKKKDGTPTAQWLKRPYGQASKCAEAEALRKAFPEELGGRPTAEEMDGHDIDDVPQAKDVTPPASRLEALEKAIASPADHVGSELGQPPSDGPQLRTPDGEVLPADKTGLVRWRDAWKEHVKDEATFSEFNVAARDALSLFPGQQKLTDWISGFAEQMRVQAA